MLRGVWRGRGGRGEVWLELEMVVGSLRLSGSVSGLWVWGIRLVRWGWMVFEVEVAIAVDVEI